MMVYHSSRTLLTSSFCVHPRRCHLEILSIFRLVRGYAVKILKHRRSIWCYEREHSLLQPNTWQQAYADSSVFSYCGVLRYWVGRCCFQKRMVGSALHSEHQLHLGLQLAKLKQSPVSVRKDIRKAWCVFRWCNPLLAWVVAGPQINVRMVSVGGTCWVPAAEQNWFNE